MVSVIGRRGSKGAHLAEPPLICKKSLEFEKQLLKMTAVNFNVKRCDGCPFFPILDPPLISEMKSTSDLKRACRA
jgi:hypothetical protein